MTVTTATSKDTVWVFKIIKQSLWKLILDVIHYCWWGTVLMRSLDLSAPSVLSVIKSKQSKRGKVGAN
jgi:hypothetical protein